MKTFTLDELYKLQSELQILYLDLEEFGNHETILGTSIDISCPTNSGYIDVLDIEHEVQYSYEDFRNRKIRYKEHWFDKSFKLKDLPLLWQEYLTVHSYLTDIMDYMDKYKDYKDYKDEGDLIELKTENGEVTEQQLLEYYGFDISKGLRALLAYFNNH